MTLNGIYPHGPGVGAVVRCAEARLPLASGEFRAIAYRGRHGGQEHIALVAGDPSEEAGRCLVRVHSECLTGDALASLRCDCGEQLKRALHDIAATGCGVLVYVRGHEGRGIGLAEKIRAYQLQDGGLDTVDANLRLGHAADERTYDQAAAILLDLGARRIRLLTNNPDKVEALTACGIIVLERVPLHTRPNQENQHYLRVKREKMGHH